MLPDVLAPGLDIVFCGTAVGHESARRRAYYAGPGNRFWPTLHAVGLTPRPLQPEECREVLSFGLGLTDLVKVVAGVDAELSTEHFDALIRTPPESLHGKTPPYDYLRLEAVVEFGLNEGIAHLQDDVERLTHADANTGNSYAVHLYRLSSPGKKFSSRDWSSNSALVCTVQQVQEGCIQTQLGVGETLRGLPRVLPPSNGLAWLPGPAAQRPHTP